MTRAVADILQMGGTKLRLPFRFEFTPLRLRFLFLASEVLPPTNVKPSELLRRTEEMLPKPKGPQIVK